ncbi:MAG: hypothetical protein ACKPIC_21700, partial [Microcystis panniformis]
NFWRLRKTRSGGQTKSCLKGIGEWGVGCGEKGVPELRSGEQGETIHNLRVNHTIENGFGLTSVFRKTICLFWFCRLT